MTCSAAARFEEARQAFAARDYAAAVKNAQAAETLVRADIQISDYGAPTSPTYSIIVVLYQRHSDLGQALGRLSRYSDIPEFELIFVNNGEFVADDIVEHCKKFRWIDVGFNFGCSGARNLGARAARGSLLIFIDDDGFIEDLAIERLIENITEHDALAVRGRVRPKSESRSELPRNYDLGDDVIYSVPNAEGISIWRRQEFLDHGGFDTLLAGGEGLALWSRMYGSDSLRPFLYSPDAVLLHDFAKDPQKVARKKSKHTPNKEYLSLAYPDAQRKRWEAAAKFGEGLVLSDPENANLHHNLGNALEKLGRLDEAEAAQKRAVALQPEFAGAHRRLSGIFARQNRDDEALAAAQRAVECDPENARLQQRLGNLLQKQGRLSEGEAAQRRAIELDPGWVPAYRQLSSILVQEGRRNEALAVARRAVECDPENAGLHRHLGNLLQKYGKLEEAEAVQQRAIELEPELANRFSNEQVRSPTAEGDEPRVISGRILSSKLIQLSRKILRV
jgi:tetratricopeptide (TPR) repeat protein